MAEIKAVFFDLDGTLLTSTRGVADSTRQAITDLRRSGVLVGIATGRGPSFALPLMEDLGLNFAVTYNGQYIMDSKNVLYENPIDKRLLRDIIRYSAENRRDISFGKADGVSGSGLLKFGESRTAGVIAGILPKSAAGAARNIFKNFVRPFNPNVYDLRQILKEPVYQIMMVATSKETDGLVYKFPDLTVTRSSPYTADIISAGVSKLVGIKRVGEIYGFSVREAMVFGDSANDEMMIKGAGVGVAMENAEASVKEIADYTTASNNQDGIAKALAYYGLVKYSSKESFVSKDVEYNRVKEFHRLMDGETQEIPKAFSAIEASRRTTFKVEELIEFLYAAANGDPARFDGLVVQMHQDIERAVMKVESKPMGSDPLTAQVDSLIDLLYFTYGSLVLAGVDPYEIFDVVHEANMQKIFPDGTPHFDTETEKLLKPEGWEARFSPERKIRQELDRQTRVAMRKTRSRRGEEKA